MPFIILLYAKMYAPIISTHVWLFMFFYYYDYSASDALCHPWLENADNVDVFYAPS